MLASSLVDFGVGWALDKTETISRRKWLVGISVVCNLGLLGFFKYFNFFAESLQSLAATFYWRIDPFTVNVILPVGISFYTFQTMGYTIDVYRKKLPATHNIVDYLAYVSFFPQLVAGPIERAPRFLPQFQKPRTFDREAAVDGCRLILWGVFKKLVIADRLAVVVDMIYSNPSQSTGIPIFVGTIAFAFQIYCDFSAYSEIAMGTAQLLGFRLMQNFRTPYFSQSMREFWQRWHISLSTWFRDYVYIPLGGSQGGTSTYLRSILITFLLSGLWHGASWNFVIWGGLMGVGVAVETLLNQRQTAPKTVESPTERLSLGWHLKHQVLVTGRILRTFAIVCLGWVFFRAATFGDAIYCLQQMTTCWFDANLIDSASQIMAHKDVTKAIIPLVWLLFVEWMMRDEPHTLLTRLPWRWSRWLVYTGTIWVILLVYPEAETRFIYFQF